MIAIIMPMQFHPLRKNKKQPRSAIPSHRMERSLLYLTTETIEGFFFHVPKPGHGGVIMVSENPMKANVPPNPTAFDRGFVVEESFVSGPRYVRPAMAVGPYWR